jgi:Uma2 family endonuclease
MIADPKRPFAGRRFTVAEYEDMIETGVLTEDDRVELIHGEVIPKMPPGRRHIAHVNRLIRLFSPQIIGRALISTQNPIILADSEPEPDFALLAPRADDYESAKPTAADAFLVIEVSDSSVDFDRETKGPLYAQNGIPEYWLIDLTTNTVTVHRGPRPDGTWASADTLTAGDTLAVAALPGVGIPVADLLPTSGTP